MIVFSIVLVIFCALVSAGLITAFLPVIKRRIVAQPTDQGSHTEATPQGGGGAVIAALVVGSALAWPLLPEGGVEGWRLALVLAAATGLAITGLADDMNGIGITIRLLLQTAGAIAILASFPSEARIFPEFLPYLLERALLLVGTVWFLNLTNFMDGIDFMMVSETASKAAALAILSIMGAATQDVTLVALALLGGILGFAPFNAPKARLFLGDAGSLPIGLLMAWMLISLAMAGHVPAALLITLYAIADTTVTLFRRLGTKKSISIRHRSHFYHQAFDSGLSVLTVTGRVFVLNIFLAMLAGLTVIADTIVVDLPCLATGALATGLVLALSANKTR
jgi:UDP-N-acetylmuramyl pentapeptide phosphotransferase/UDP-N-acetylglucosamine-1-phosphate transferase